MRLSAVVCLAAFGWLAVLHVASANTPARLDDPYTNEGETQTFTVNADGSYAKFSSMTRGGATHCASEVCTPDDFAQMRPALEAIGRDVRAEVIVKSTLVEPSSVVSQAP